MSDWKDLNIEGISRIEQVVIRCDVIAISRFPAPNVRVNIMEDAAGNYRGTTNMAVIDPKTSKPLWVEGRGETAKIALEETIRLLMESTHGLRLSQEDVIWKDAKDS